MDDHREMQSIIALAISHEFFHMAGGVPEMDHVAEAGPGEMQLAGAILAMPEMQAIAQLIAADVWLRSTVRACAPSPRADNRTDPIVFMGVDGGECVVPRHVIEWALSVAGDPR